MHWHDFIFSNQRRHRIIRHFVFWATWWLYFSALYWYNQHITGVYYANFIKLGSHIFLKSFFVLFIQALACYLFIYILLPRYLVKSKWLNLTAATLLLSIVIVGIGYLMHQRIFPIIDSLNGNELVKGNPQILWTSISTGLLNAPKVIATASAIKLMKYWWLRQKEKEKLEREKIITELQLLKAQIRPDFLFHTLNNIYAYSLVGSPRASEMLLKLSDLLSYILYECDQPKVPVEREVEMMKEYMAMEKIRHKDLLEMEVSVKGELSGKKIAPFLLLPFIENSFKSSSYVTEKSWINMEIRMEENSFFMKLINGIATEIPDQPEIHADGLANVQKRLTLLYPGKHEFKMSTEQEMLIVFLSIQLDEKEELENFHAVKRNIHSTEPYLAHAPK